MRLTERLVHTLRDMQPDDILAALGLERRRGMLETWLPPIGFFCGGVVLGVGVGLLFAPMAGKDLRAGLAKRAEHFAARFRRETQAVDAQGPRAGDDGFDERPMNGDVHNASGAQASGRERHRRASTSS